MGLKTNEQFIFEAKLKHGDKYNYDKVFYTKAKNKVIIVCQEHGEFLQKPCDHLNDCGCPKCGYASRTKLKTKSIDQFIEESNKIHINDQYDYSKFVYKNAQTKGIIICKLHGEFLQAPTTHLSGCGCFGCYGTPLKSIDSFIQKANEIHNYKYDYSKFIYTKNNGKSIIICPKHGEFEQTPSNHLWRKECPRCSKVSSKPENDWLDMLEIPKEYRQQNIYFGNKRYKIDAIDLKNKIVYEFYGDFWHGNPKLYNAADINKVTKKTFGEMYSNTIKKEEIIKSAGYSMVTIWEKDFKELKGKKAKYEIEVDRTIF